VLCLALLAACGKPKKAADEPAAASAVGASAKDAPSASDPEPAKPVLAFTLELRNPYSVLYDDVADTYLVSNVNGALGEADNNGYISVLSPDGKLGRSRPKWIEGGKHKVTLNAPKGMAFVGDKLWVADLDVVRIFDRKSGAPVEEVKIPNAVSLTDVSAAPDGSRVLVTDQAMRFAPGSPPTPTGSDAIYAIDRNKTVTTVVKSKELGQPCSLYASGDKTWVASSSGELYSIDAHGKRGDVQKLPQGELCGVIGSGGDLFVTSFKAKGVYRGKPGGTFSIFTDDLPEALDPGLDTKRMRLLVPLLNSSTVRVFDLR
jgi:hypothetical protein